MELLRQMFSEHIDIKIHLDKILRHISYIEDVPLFDETDITSIVSIHPPNLRDKNGSIDVNTINTCIGDSKCYKYKINDLYEVHYHIDFQEDWTEETKRQSLARFKPSIIISPWSNQLNNILLNN